MLDLMRSEAGARRREWLDAMSEQTWAHQQAEEERQKEEAKAMAKLAARLASPPHAARSEPVFLAGSLVPMVFAGFCAKAERFWTVGVPAS